MRALVLLLLSGSAVVSAAERPAAMPCIGLLATAARGHLSQPALQECSGVIASRTQAGILWTHNDSGNAPEIFAIDQTGAARAEFSVAAANVDWEDIASDDVGRLYLADVGNNGGRRASVAVHRIAEPRVDADRSAPIPVDATWTLSYPGLPFDCEAFVVHDGWGWLIDKRLGEQAGLWRFRLDGPDRQVLEAVARLPLRTPVTGADLSADGRRLAVIGYCGLNVFALAGDLRAVANATPLHVDFLQPKIEGCCFIPGGVLATAEDRSIYLFSDALIAGNAP